jgi:hypothetical protein
MVASIGLNVTPLVDACQSLFEWRTDIEVAQLSPLWHFFYANWPFYMKMLPIFSLIY